MIILLLLLLLLSLPTLPFFSFIKLLLLVDDAISVADVVIAFANLAPSYVHHPFIKIKLRLNR